MPQYIKRQPKKARKKALKKTSPHKRGRSAISTQTAGTTALHQAAPPARPRRRRRLSAKQQEKLIAEAVIFFRASVSSNVIQAVAGRASQYAGDRTWTKLTSEWSGSNCRAMARFARELLDGNNWLHDRFADLVAWVLKAFGAHRIVYLFGRQIARQFVVFPWDHQVKIVARGMQMAGIAICVLNGWDLTDCECFIDVVIEEGKEKLKQLMLRAAGDWTGLPELGVA